MKCRTLAKFVGLVFEAVIWKDNQNKTTTSSSELPLIKMSFVVFLFLLLSDQREVADGHSVGFRKISLNCRDSRLEKLRPSEV